MPRNWCPAVSLSRIANFSEHQCSRFAKGYGGGMGEMWSDGAKTLFQAIRKPYLKETEIISTETYIIAVGAGRGRCVCVRVCVFTSLTGVE